MERQLFPHCFCYFLPQILSQYLHTQSLQKANVLHGTISIFSNSSNSRGNQPCSLGGREGGKVWACPACILP